MNDETDSRMRSPAVVTPDARRTGDHRLAFALCGLAVAYALWFRHDEAMLVAWTIFALPPLLLGLQALRGAGRLTRFLTGVFGLFWFSHGVMTAWADAGHRLPALAVVALSVMAILAANAEALRAKFGRRG